MDRVPYRRAFTDLHPIFNDRGRVNSRRIHPVTDKGALILSRTPEVSDAYRAPTTSTAAIASDRAPVGKSRRATDSRKLVRFDWNARIRSKPVPIVETSPRRVSSVDFQSRFKAPWSPTSLK